MALTVGTDSYISVADADTYFNNNVLFADSWTNAVAADKEKALKMATKRLDMQMLIGRKVDTTQVLQFPRSLYSDSRSIYGSTVEERLKGIGLSSSPRWVNETTVHQDVKDATCEEALAIIKNGAQAQIRVEMQRQGVTSFSLGSLSEAYSGVSSNPNKLLSTTAAQLLARYVGGSRGIV